MNSNNELNQQQTYTKSVQDGFTYTKDSQGRVVSVEGNIKAQNGERAQSEKTLQSQLQKEAPKDKQGKSYYDASHIIAHELGGKGKDNLVLMPQGINRSYVRAVEKELKEQTTKHDKVDVKATLAWGDSNKVPEKIKYEAWGVNKQTGERTKIHDSSTKVNWFPQQTLAQTLKKSEDIKQNTFQWASQSQDGLSKSH